MLSYAFYMPIPITEFQMDEVNTISIPTDAILMVSLLIVFALLGYFLKNILDNQTNQLVQEKKSDSNLELVKEKLEDQFTLESSKINQKNLEKPNIKTLNFLPSSKLLGLGSLAVLSIGGASLLGLQALQRSYKGVSTNQVSIKPKNQSIKSIFSMIEKQPSDKPHIRIKKISYVDPFLSTMISSKDNNYNQVQKRPKEQYFTF